MTSHTRTGTPPGTRFLRPMDVVHATGLSERTVRRWISEGKLDAVRVGRNVFVTVESYERLFGGRR